MAEKNDENKINKRAGKPLDYSKKAGGKIKRAVPTVPNVADMPENKLKKPMKAKKIKADGAKINPKSTQPTDAKKRAGYSAKTGDKPQNAVNRKLLNTPPKAKGLSVIEGGKSPKKQLKKGLIGLACAILAVVIAALCLSTPTGVGEWLKSKMSVNVAGSGFPVNFSQTEQNHLFVNNGQLFTLSNTQLRCYNSSGGEIFSRLHGFTSPVTRFSKLRFLTFDRGGTQYRTDSFADELGINKCTYKIIDGDIADNGNYVLATLSENEAALVTVYDKQANELYKFHSADNYISGAAISDDGKTIAIASVNADKSVITSEIQLYSIKSTKAIAKKTFENETVYAMQFSGNSAVSGISNKRWFSLDKSGNENEKSYDSKTLVKYEFLPNGNTLLCLSGASNSDNNSFLIIKPDSSTVLAFDKSITVTSVSASDDKIFVLSSKLFAYSYSGELISQTETDSGAISVKAAFGKAAVLYPSNITLY